MLEDEISRLQDLKEVGIALVQFAKSQFLGLRFESNEQGRYVATPENFVTFSIHWQRAKNITVTLRGNPEEFLAFDELQLKSDRQDIVRSKSLMLVSWLQRHFAFGERQSYIGLAVCAPGRAWRSSKNNFST